MPRSAFSRILRSAFASGAILAATTHPARAQDGPASPDPASRASVAGAYVLSQMEMIAGIRLRADGTFEYGLTVGSLDEQARGRWTIAGKRIDLTSDPRPIAPTITPGAIDSAPGEPFAIRVLTPKGRDLPGIDLRIDFDTGEPLISYLAGGPWSLPPAERRTPRFVTFSQTSYRLQSERLPLSAKAGTIATFKLIPNDFGVADLTGSYAEIDGVNLTLYRPEGVMRFKRAQP
jgi:hypothetical protein